MHCFDKDVDEAIRKGLAAASVARIQMVVFYRMIGDVTQVFVLWSDWHC